MLLDPLATLAQSAAQFQNSLSAAGGRYNEMVLLQNGENGTSRPLSCAD
jgi:hypothetical protein